MNAITQKLNLLIHDLDGFKSERMKSLVECIRMVANTYAYGDIEKLEQAMKTYKNPKLIGIEDDNERAEKQ